MRLKIFFRGDEGKKGMAPQTPASVVFLGEFARVNAAGVTVEFEALGEQERISTDADER